MGLSQNWAHLPSLIASGRAGRAASAPAGFGDLLSPLTTIVAGRDHRTALHAERTARMAHHLACAVGVDEHSADMIAEAAPLHDIGERDIPDTILCKPGTLTLEERQAINSHCARGAEMLTGGGSALIELARLIALTHHERWDGAGYPAGLVGDDIPLAARIVSIVDVFDGLTAERSYKRGWSVAEAVGFIRDNAGGHLDPTLVAIFYRELPRLLAIRNECGQGSDHAPG